MLCIAYVLYLERGFPTSPFWIIYKLQHETLRCGSDGLVETTQWQSLMPFVKRYRSLRIMENPRKHMKNLSYPLEELNK